MGQFDIWSGVSRHEDSNENINLRTYIQGLYSREMGLGISKLLNDSDNSGRLSTKKRREGEGEGKERRDLKNLIKYQHFGD